MTASGTVTGAAARVGGADYVLTNEEVDRFVREQLDGVDADGRTVCVLVPDATRSFPLPLLLRAVHRELYGRVSRLTVLVALGRRAPMDDDALAAGGLADEALLALAATVPPGSDGLVMLLTCWPSGHPLGARPARRLSRALTAVAEGSALGAAALGLMALGRCKQLTDAMDQPASPGEAVEERINPDAALAMTYAELGRSIPSLVAGLNLVVSMFGGTSRSRPTTNVRPR